MSNKSKYTNRFDIAGMWASLPTYFVIWCFFGSWFLHPELVWFAFALAVVYVSMQVYEINWRHHCFLSADSTAGPATFLAFVCLAVYGYRIGLGGPLLIDFAYGSLAAFFVGHIAALAVAGLFHVAGEWSWRNIVQHKSG